MVTLIIPNACSDSFLDEQVLDKYAPESLRDKLGFDAAVVGLHQHFATHLKSTNDQGLIAIWHAGTDIVWVVEGRHTNDLAPYYNYTQMNAADAASRKVWSYLYKMISNANTLIKGSESEIPGMTQAEKDVYNGEARFFRAYAYNMLVTLYGDVPLLTEPLTAPKTDFARTAAAEINNTIEQDLLLAIDKLPKIGEAAQGGRANKAMARQLLAEAYLRMGENAKAEAQCTAIIDGSSGALSLVRNRYGVKANQPGDPFSDMFIFGNQRRSQGNTEAIWVLENENPTDKPYTTDSPQQRRVWGGGYYDIPGMQPADSLGGRGLARVRLNNWVLYQLYEKQDMRNSRYNIRRQWYFNNTQAKFNNIRGQAVPYGETKQFTVSDGSKITVNAQDTIWRLTPYTTKWAQFDARDEFGYGMWKDFILMRLGETYLLRAEARFKQGNAPGAADDINTLRSRANASQITPADVTLDFILDERVRELVSEENRRMTLMRTGKLRDRAISRNGEGVLPGGINTVIGIREFYDKTQGKMFLPIPQTEIDLNKDAQLPQNPGY
jgi:starch-binding outer membrane protein, SusD/RagB family